MYRFRWVACQIDELKRCPNQKSIMETLRSLPKSLESTYDQIFQRIDEKEIPAARVILQWLVLGMRPLTAEELAIIVTFDTSAGNFDSSLGLASPDDVIHLCSSLVIKTGDNTVQLAHASVKEYFLQKAGNIALFANSELGHTHIADCCLTFLLDNMENTPGYKELTEYSAKFWPSHYRCSNRNETLQDLVKIVLWDADWAFKKCEYHNADFKQLEWKYKEKRSPLHYAAQLGLEDIMKVTLINNEWQWAYCALLEIGVNEGYIGIVELLLDRGVDINTQVGKIGNALQIASYRGYPEIVELLLERNADVNAQGSGTYGNALQAAASDGHIDIVMLLLDWGADVNAQGGEFGNALEAATLFGYTEIVRLLLDKNADISVVHEEFGGVLQIASAQGFTEIVRMFLDKNADVNAQNGVDNRTALGAASANGQTEIVRLLDRKSVV